ncbi:MAG: nickel-responsive transcriptional regulator NikR [bacterium]
MGDLVRFGVSIDEDLLKEFDDLIEKKGYANRSEAIRGLIRNMLLEARSEEGPDAEAIGTIALVYDHSTRDLSDRLVDLQHKYHHFIVSTLHVHIDERDCLEVLVVRGRNRRIRRISDYLIGTRGVKYGKLIINTTGKAIPADLKSQK